MYCNVTFVSGPLLLLVALHLDGWWCLATQTGQWKCSHCEGGQFWKAQLGYCTERQGRVCNSFKIQAPVIGVCVMYTDLSSSQRLLTGILHATLMGT